MSKPHYDSFDAGEEWGTPSYIWKPLAEALDGFDLDPASGAESEPIAETCVSLPTDEHNYGSAVIEGDSKRVFDDGLERKWSGDVWVNPPYSRKNNPRWADKFWESMHNHSVDTITALVPASTSTNWWHDNYAKADYFTFIDHRVGFEGDVDGKASFASVLVTAGDVPQEYLDACQELGHVVESL